MSDDIENAPRGLPGPLPAGEHILWQGAPSWSSLAVRALHVRLIALYFAVITMWRAGVVMYGGGSVTDAVSAAAALLPVAALALAILCGLAWIMARTTVYTITNKRIVMKIGVAIIKTINLPFAIIGSAALKTYANGTGDIPVALTGTGRMAYLHLWPHARPWRVKTPEPMLRSIPDAARVAGILSGAMTAASKPADQAAQKPRGKRMKKVARPHEHAAAA